MDPAILVCLGNRPFSPSLSLSSVGRRIGIFVKSNSPKDFYFYIFFGYSKFVV